MDRIKEKQMFNFCDTIENLHYKNSILFFIMLNIDFHSSIIKMMMQDSPRLRAYDKVDIRCTSLL